MSECDGKFLLAIVTGVPKGSPIKLLLVTGARIIFVTLVSAAEIATVLSVVLVIT